MRWLVATGASALLACATPPCEEVQRLPNGLLFSGSGEVTALRDGGIARAGCDGVTLYDAALQERGHVDLAGAWRHSVAIAPDGSGFAYRSGQLLRFSSAGDIETIATVEIPESQPTQGVTLSVQLGSAGLYLSGPDTITVDGERFDRHPALALDPDGAVRFAWASSSTATSSVLGTVVQDGAGNDILLRYDMGAPALRSVDAIGASRWVIPIAGFDVLGITADPAGGVIAVILFEGDELQLPGRTLVASPDHTFAVAIDRDGGVRWATMLDDGIDDARALSATSAGELLIGGRYSGTALDLPDTASIDGYPDPFVARVGPSGVASARNLPGRGNVSTHGIAPTADGDVWLSVGFTSGPDNRAELTLDDLVLSHDGEALLAVAP